jgi:hypothetical protein
VLRSGVGFLFASHSLLDGWEEVNDSMVPSLLYRRRDGSKADFLLARSLLGCYVAMWNS